MKCPSCNEDLPDDSVFCTGCGDRLSVPPGGGGEYVPPGGGTAPPPPGGEYVPPGGGTAPPPPGGEYVPPGGGTAPPPPGGGTAPPPPVETKPTPRLVLPDNSTILIDAEAKVIGRVELLTYLNSLPDVDPNVVSRKHFSILYENGKYHIEDGTTSVQEKPSANHTFINGEDITGKGKRELNEGTVIDIAESKIKITFKIS